MTTVDVKTMHEAFVEAYADMLNPKKNASNPAFKSKYANLEELLNVTRPILAALGFALVQEPVNDSERSGVHTKLIYKTGAAIDFGAYTVPLTKHDAQGAGSAITYCRRYAIASIFGLAQEDDDGNSASSRSSSASAPAPKAELRINAVWGKAKALGWNADDLAAWISEKSGGKISHPDQMNAASLSSALDAMQRLIDERETAPVKAVSIGDEDIPF